jgi:hypothetical protein
MKTLFKRIAWLMAAVILTQCAPIERDTETMESIFEMRKNLTQAESYYLGDVNDIGTDVYDLRIMTDGVGVNYKLSSDKITLNAYKGNGYVLYFELNTGEETDTFPVGEFTADQDESFDEGTFSNAYCIVLNSGAIAADAVKLKIIGGKVNVSKSGNDYTVKMDVTTVEETKLDLSYSGKIEVGDPVYIREPFSGKNVELEIDDISFVSENFDSDGDRIKESSVGKLTLTGDDGIIVITDIFDEDMYPIGKEPARLAPGTYTLTEKTYEPFTFIRGKNNGKVDGSYAWLSDESGIFTEIFYLVEATMVVKETGNEYSVSITATSANGSTITANYKN